MKLEVVTTTFNSKSTIHNFLTILDEAIADATIGKKVKLTIVDDGSSDGTIQFIEKIDKTILRHLSIRLVELSRNFGHHKAILEGVRYFSMESDLLLIIDSDGEENPHELSRMMKIIRQEKSDMVIAYLEKRQTRGMRKMLADLAEKILQMFILNKSRNRVCTLRLITSTVVKSMKELKFTDPVLATIDSEIGFKKTYFQTSKENKGISEYTLRKRFKLFLNLLFFNSEFIKRFSIALSLFGILTAIFVFISLILYRFYSLNPLPGFSATNLLISGFSGLTITLLSTLNLLVWRVLDEGQRGFRPYVKRVLDFDA
jgi:putative glycosyltransferase